MTKTSRPAGVEVADDGERRLAAPPEIAAAIATAAARLQDGGRAPGVRSGWAPGGRGAWARSALPFTRQLTGRAERP